MTALQPGDLYGIRWFIDWDRYKRFYKLFLVFV